MWSFFFNLKFVLMALLVNISPFCIVIPIICYFVFRNDAYCLKRPVLVNNYEKSNIEHYYYLTVRKLRKVGHVELHDTIKGHETKCLIVVVYSAMTVFHTIFAWREPIHNFVVFI